MEEQQQRAAWALDIIAAVATMLEPAPSTVISPLEPAKEAT